MHLEDDSPGHHLQRSDFIRRLIQAPPPSIDPDNDGLSVPRLIVQYWHDLQALPADVQECMDSWSRWGSNGFEYLVFDARSAARFIEQSLGSDHLRAFMRCYHPAMQADYFRLCYLFINGGMYVDADDVCIAKDISELFVGSGVKVQPLCYDIASDSMVQSEVFLQAGTNREGLIFYVNNNPLIACEGDPIVSRALERATLRLNDAAEDELPEIQSTTGPGNLSRIIFELGARYPDEHRVTVLRNWDSIGTSKWPLGYRTDGRNWRLSNGKRFAFDGKPSL
ncbi:MAG: glycosyltransferase [Rubrivivax sp.]